MLLSFNLNLCLNPRVTVTAGESRRESGARQSGDLSSSNEEALGGILGFGKANSSMISQLASSGKVKKMFAHCLNGVNGGGIFAIGHVVQPKVNMTPLLPDQYAIHLIHFRMRLVFLIVLLITLLRISLF